MNAPALHAQDQIGSPIARREGNAVHRGIDFAPTAAIRTRAVYGHTTAEFARLDTSPHAPTAMPLRKGIKARETTPHARGRAKDGDFSGGTHQKARDDRRPDAAR